MARRILGMGDVLSIIEKAQEAITEDDVKKMEKKLKENSFTLQDYLEQFEMVKKMGGVGSVLSLMPGANKMKINEGDIDEHESELIRSAIEFNDLTAEDILTPRVDIVAVDVDESLVDADGKLHLERAGLVAYAHGTYFELGKKIGTFGFSVAKKKKKPQPKKK